MSDVVGGVADWWTGEFKLQIPNLEFFVEGLELVQALSWKAGWFCTFLYWFASNSNKVILGGICDHKLHSR